MPSLPDTPQQAGLSLWVGVRHSAESSQPWTSGSLQPNSLPLAPQHLQINWTGLTNLLDAPGIK